eukprot:COSAG02_NODE_3046_length_7478_cov_8.135926_1_plen_57_part_10
MLCGHHPGVAFGHVDDVGGPGGAQGYQMGVWGGLEMVHVWCKRWSVSWPTGILCDYC